MQALSSLSPKLALKSLTIFSSLGCYHFTYGFSKQLVSKGLLK